jgi:hypothetical protein
MPRPRGLAALGGHGDLEAVGNPSGLLQADGRCGEQTSVVVCSNNDSQRSKCCGSIDNGKWACIG